MRTISLFFFIVANVFCAEHNGYWCDAAKDYAAESGQDIALPKEFCLVHYATVVTPRTLEIAPNGDVFVGSPSTGTPGAAPTGLGGVYVLPDDNLDGKADDILQYFVDDPTTHGILIAKDRFYYTTEDAVWAVPYTTGDRSVSTDNPTQVADLAFSKMDRWTHTLAYDAKNDDLYVSTGQYESGTSGVCNDDFPRNDRVGAVLKIGKSHPLQGDVVVKRCRNPMYLNCQDWACYAMELSGDGWRSQTGTEKLVELVEGTDIGYPCCIQPNQPNRSILTKPDCSNVTQHVADFTLTTTPFGFDWEVQKNFPGEYKGQLFMAFHGQFVSHEHAGITYLKWDHEKNKPVEGAVAQQFIPGGFGNPPGTIGERPTALKFHPDGRMFFTDDFTGKIFWIAPKCLRRPSKPGQILKPAECKGTGSGTTMHTSMVMAAACVLAMIVL